MTTDASFTPQDYLRAEAVVDSIEKNLAIEFQMNGETWDRETMQQHVNQRGALLLTKKLLLDEGERLLKHL